MKTLIILSLLFSTAVYSEQASEKLTDNKENTDGSPMGEKPQSSSQKEKTSKWYAGFSLGSVTFPTVDIFETYSDDSSIIHAEIELDGSVGYTLTGGIEFKRHFFELIYSGSEHDVSSIEFPNDIPGIKLSLSGTLNISSLYLGYSYNLTPSSKYDFYLGVHTGYTSVEINDVSFSAPELANILTLNDKATIFGLGFSAGIRYPLQENLSLDANLKFTSLSSFAISDSSDSSSSEYFLTRISSLNVGVVYFFD